MIRNTNNKNGCSLLIEIGEDESTVSIYSRVYDS